MAASLGHAAVTLHWAVQVLVLALGCLPAAQADQEVTVAPADAASPDPGREVSIEVANVGTLAGTFLLPEGAKAGSNVPAVVFITGSGLQDRDETIFSHKPFRALAEELRRAGIASLRCDDRGFGKSTGDPSSATTLDFCEDAKAQIAWVKAQPEIDPRRVGVIGHSEGAMIGVLLAQGPDAPIAFAALLAPPGIPGHATLTGQTEDLYRAGGVDPMLGSMAIEKHRELMEAMVSGASEAQVREAMRGLVEAQLECAMRKKPPSELIEVGVVQGMAQINTPWMREFIALDPAPALEKGSVAMLILLGSKDLQVGPGRNLAPLREAGAKAPVPPTIQVIDGVNHLFQPANSGLPQEYATIKVAISPEVVKQVVQWIAVRTLLSKDSATASPASSP